MVGIEIACRGCPLNIDCDPHLGPYKYINGVLFTYPTKYECPSYTCNDGRIDARKVLQTGKPKNYRVVVDGKLSTIRAVPFGECFQKFAGVIASFPKGDIFSLPPGNGNVYYRTGQSAFFNK